MVDLTEVPLSLYTLEVPGVDGPPFIDVISVLEFDPNFRDPSLKKVTQSLRDISTPAELTYNPVSCRRH